MYLQFSQEKEPGIDKNFQADFDEKRTVEKLKAEILELKRQLKAKDNIIRGSIEDTVMFSEKTCQFYTGKSKAEIKAIWRLLGGQIENSEFVLPEEKSKIRIFGLKTKKGKQRYCNDLPIKPFPQFLLALMKLKRGYYYKEYHFRFHLNSDMVAKVIQTWLQLLYTVFKEMEGEMFVKTSDITKPLPKAFRNNLLRKTRSVIDCTEFFCESAKNQRQQGQIFSNYKHHTTYKCLISVAPSGACQFVSELFEGSMSDKAITRESGYYEHINDGDEVLADRCGY